MNLNISTKDNTIYISWNKIQCDYFRIFCKIKDTFVECAQTKDTDFVSLSLLPVGENSCFVQAIKNGTVIDESKPKNFCVNEIDVVVFKNTDGQLEIHYSEFETAKGYRLYADNKNNEFGGKFSTENTTMLTEYNKDISYKIKPFTIASDKSRVILHSSPIFKCSENTFEALSIYKSYGNKMFLSWLYNGRADGFTVFQEGSEFPIFETSDGLRHYAYLTNYNEQTKFYIKAYVNSPKGKIYVKTSDYVQMKEREFSSPEISIIIPAYNSQDYIARSIDSALASTFDDFEIIIVNDGSTDSTQEIIEWYESEYYNIHVIQKQNGGVADARNVGIKEAKGEYIAFLDNDDMFRPNMLENLYQTICKNKCDVAIAPLYRMLDNGYTIHCKLPFETDTAHDIDKYLSIMYTPHFYNCAIWNKLYKASIVKEHPLGKLRYEDVSWTPCILSYAKTFCCLDTPFYEWDRKLREKTFGDILAQKPEDELFEHRKQAMLFFVEKGNPEKLQFLKTIAKRRLMRYDGNSKHPGYKELIERIDTDEYVEY